MTWNREKPKSNCDGRLCLVSVENMKKEKRVCIGIWNEKEGFFDFDGKYISGGEWEWSWYAWMIMPEPAGEIEETKEEEVPPYVRLVTVG